MEIGYLDGTCGISGDMFLGALIDAGLEPRKLLDELKKVPLGFYRFKRTRSLRGGLVGTRVEIEIPETQPHRHLSDIEAMIGQAELPGAAKEMALRVFRRLGEAEAKLHNVPVEHVHFHEVGAVDAIVDIVGTCVGLELMGIQRLTSSPLNVGSGQTEAAHGRLPVPAPATAELLKGIPVYSSGVEAELVTPTGAALVSTLAAEFGPMPAMKIERVGYGAGQRELPHQPNLARLVIGEESEVPKAEVGAPGNEVVSIVETNVDDMNPQIFGYLVERALAAGALDVTCAPLEMKKNRPGFQLSVIAKPEDAEALANLLFDETTTLGVRIYEARRKTLEREWMSVETEYGAVRVKVARREGKIVNLAPEYEDCERLAKEKNAPLKEVMAAASAACRAKTSGISGH
jgi:uncharacterized protein (TIGR00299 family) protein